MGMAWHDMLHMQVGRQPEMHRLRSSKIEISTAATNVEYEFICNGFHSCDRTSRAQVKIEVIISTERLLHVVDPCP